MIDYRVMYSVIFFAFAIPDKKEGNRTVHAKQVTIKTKTNFRRKHLWI